MILAAAAIAMAYALVSGSDAFGLTSMTYFGDVERDFVAMLTNGKIPCLCPIR